MLDDAGAPAVGAEEEARADRVRGVGQRVAERAEDVVAAVGEGEELGVEAEVEAVLRGVLHQDGLEQSLWEVEVPAWAGFVVFALVDGF